jgi:xanthine/CO dehydrogenase XdhC/CoxF family maturation factor
MRTDVRLDTSLELLLEQAPPEPLGAAADGLRTRLRGPVGIDIGAVTPEAIGLAIVSQVHAALAGRPGGGAAT